MSSARLKINFDSPAKDYVKIIGKGTKYKRGSVSFKATKNDLEISITANDPVAMLSSLSSAIKQLKVVSGVDSLIKKNGSR